MGHLTLIRDNTPKAQPPVAPFDTSAFARRQSERKHQARIIRLEAEARRQKRIEAMRAAQQRRAQHLAHMRQAYVDRRAATSVE